MHVVEKIIIRTPPATLQNIYNLPEFGSTLEFLMMLALSGGRLLKVKTCSMKFYLISPSVFNYDLNSLARQVLNVWNQQKNPYFSEPPAIHPSLIPSLGKFNDKQFFISVTITNFCIPLHSYARSSFKRKRKC